jgi:general secretion pathway protein E
MTEDVRQLIGARADSGAIEQAAVRAGMTTMVDDAMAKCRAGVTSVFEVLRVTTVR